MITREGTKPGQPTIEDIRDMVQNDPRYDKLTRAEMDKALSKKQSEQTLHTIWV